MSSRYKRNRSVPSKITINRTTETRTLTRSELNCPRTPVCRIEIDENTSLQHSLEKSYDDAARAKRDQEQAKRDVQQLQAEIESIKVNICVCSQCVCVCVCVCVCACVCVCVCVLAQSLLCTWTVIAIQLQDELEHQQALHQEARSEVDTIRKDKDNDEISLRTVAKDKEQIKVCLNVLLP